MYLKISLRERIGGKYGCHTLNARSPAIGAKGWERP